MKVTKKKSGKSDFEDDEDENLGLLTLLTIAKRKKPTLGVKLRKLQINLKCRLKAVKVRPTKRLILKQLLEQGERSKTVPKYLCKKKRRWWVRPIFRNHSSHGAWFTSIPIMKNDDPDKFYNFFRMNGKTFDFLLELVTPLIAKKRTSFREAVCPGERLAITLRYFASGDSFLSLSYLFLVSDQLISEIVFETSVVIWEVLEPIVFEPLDEELWLKVASEYEVMWKMPHCMGAIDGKHCFIKAPPHSGSRFFSYKHRYSLILMAVADAKRKFIMVDVGASGRRGDGNVFHASVFGKMLNRNNLNIPPPCPYQGVEGNLPFFLIGDGAFERSENLLNPFRTKSGILNAPQRVFNSRFSGARHCIEDAFGILYQRYGVFMKPMEVSKTCARKIIMACCALHNMHLMDWKSVSPKWRRPYPHLYSHREDEEGNIIPGRYKLENLQEETKALHRLRINVLKTKKTGIQEADDLVGEDIREVLLDYFIDNLEPWQFNKAHVL